VRRISPLPVLLLAAALADPDARADAVVTGSLGGTSDFVFRGISLTRGKPAVQGSLDVEFPGELYVGAFVATTDPNPGPSPNYEADAWIGRYWRVSEDFSADLRLSQYTYPDDPRRLSYNRTEITGTIGFRNALYAAAIYSPNTRAVGPAPGYAPGDVWAFELSGRHALNDIWSLSAGIGHYGLDNVYHASYNYWNATVTATLAPFDLQLAYIGTDHGVDQHFSGDTTGNRLALTALWRFSSTK